MWYIKGLNVILYESYVKISGVFDIGIRCFDYMYNLKEIVLIKIRLVLILLIVLFDIIYF